MCHKTPSKLLRNIKRMTKFLEVKKEELTLSLSIQNISQIDIPPSLRPRSTNMSYRKFQQIEIVPGTRNDDIFLFSSYIDGRTFKTIFVCHFCYDDYTFRSADSLRTHIQTVHRKEMHQKLKIKPDLQPIFETICY